jgi:hypothetical protein
MPEQPMVTIDIARDFFLWCAIVNYAILVAWFLAFTFGHQMLYRIHTRWFQLSVPQFDAIHYSGMAVYKLAVLVLNVVPYIALRIVISYGI